VEKVQIKHTAGSNANWDIVVSIESKNNITYDDQAIEPP
jgi:hypothetical protein